MYLLIYYVKNGGHEMAGNSDFQDSKNSTGPVENRYLALFNLTQKEYDCVSIVVDTMSSEYSPTPEVTITKLQDKEGYNVLLELCGFYNTVSIYHALTSFFDMEVSKVNATRTVSFNFNEKQVACLVFLIKHFKVRVTKYSYPENLLSNT